MVRTTRVMVLVALLLASAVAFGQAVSGDLVGTVTDNSGAVIPNVTVTAVHNATGVKNVQKTSAQGEYRFTNLPAGSYNVTFSADKFATKTLRNVTVELSKTATLNQSLAVGTVAETVEVTDALPTIDTTTAQMQTSYEMKVVADLPAVAQNVQNLSLLQAGVGTSGGIGAGSGPSIGGQRPRNNNFTVEGIDNNDKGVTGPEISVPNEAVQEFTLLQNQFNPEFGHSTAGQFNTSLLSGTNSLHGALYEYFQNRDLNGVDYSASRQGTTQNPRYDNNRFGGKVGGPIVKNKLFFFFLYEYNPIGQAALPSATLKLPTAAGYTALLAIPGVSATNINGLKQYAVAPAATSGCGFAVAGQTIQCGDMPVIAPNFTNNKALVTTMDYNVSDRDQIRGRFIRTNASQTDTAAALPIFYTGLATPGYLFALSEFHTFSPTTSNEFRVGYNRYGYNYTVPGTKFGNLDTFPNITIDETNLNLGPDPNAPQYSTQNVYQATEALTTIRGKHTLKVGGGYTKWISPQLFIQRARGDYSYNTLSEFAFDQYPYFGERSMGTTGYSGDQYNLSWFVNDSVKLRPNLTANIGVRYEYLSVPYGWSLQGLNYVANVPGLINFSAPVAPKKDFMPRIGFAYSPGSSGNTSIRGGFGMGYDVLYDNIGLLAVPPQLGSTVDCNTTDHANPVCPLLTSGYLAQGGIRPQGGAGITALTPADALASTSNYLPTKVQYPYSIQWNLGVQHVFHKDYTVEVRYVGTRGVHLDVQQQMNKMAIVTPTYHLPTYIGAAPSQAVLNALPLTLEAMQANSAVLPAFRAAGLTSTITSYPADGSSIYHGLSTQINRRFSNGLYFQGSWTWSHTIDNSTADFFSTVLTPRRAQDGQNFNADRSNSALDRAHRFTLAIVYDVPWMKHSNSFLKNVVGNWEFAPVYTFETGEWATVQSGVDANLNGDSAGDRTIVNPNGVKGTGSAVTALHNNAGATVGYLATNPNAYYIQAGLGALATDGRNTLQMPGINNIDLTLKKSLSVTERYKVEFSALMLNAMNHPQFIGGSLNQITSISQTSTAVGNSLKPNSTLFNQFNQVLPSNTRTMQLALKFIF